MADILYVENGYVSTGYVVRTIVADPTTLTTTVSVTATGGEKPSGTSLVMTAGTLVSTPNRVRDPTLGNSYTWDEQTSWDVWLGEYWDSTRKITLTTAASLTATGIIKPKVLGTASVTSISSVSALAGYQKSAQASLPGVSTFAVAATVKPPVTASAILTSTTSITALGGYQKSGTSAVVTVNTLSGSANTLRLGVAALSSAVTLELLPTLAIMGSATLSSVGFATVTANAAFGSLAQLTAVSTLTCVPGRIRDAGLDPSTITWNDQTQSWDTWLGEYWTPNITGIRLVGLASTLIVGISGQAAFLTSTATLTAQAGYIKGLVATVTSSATLAAIGDRLIRGTATMLAQAQLAAQATRIHPGVAAITAEATVAATSQRVRGVQGNLSSAFSLTGSGARVVFANATITSVASILGLGGTLRLATASLNAFDFLVTVADIIAIDTDFFVTVDPESGIIQVLADHRMLTVQEETGLNIILPEYRGLVVPQETRQETVL